MAKRDARTLSSETQAELRRQCVKLKKQGLTHQEVADTLEVSIGAIRKWCGIYSKGGMKALKLGQRGRRFGECRSLTSEQERRIRERITDKTPDQLKLPFALWTREAVRDVIEIEFGFRMPIRTVGEYLSRWGYTPQRPRKQAYQQQPKEVKRWLKESYPAIEARAKAEKAEIQWGDETGISSEDNRGRGFAPRGHTPTVNVNARRFSISMISTITNRGKVRFMIYPGALKADIFLNFLKRLTHKTKKKIFLIVDNLRVHRAIKVQDWVKMHSSKIELFFLPPYSPELNPDEYLNNTVKSQLRKKKTPHSKEELQLSLLKCMKSNQKRSALIQKLFHHPSVKYAAG